jgi:DNA-binding CsgD family transcriptional regulator
MSPVGGSPSRERPGRRCQGAKRASKEPERHLRFGGEAPLRPRPRARLAKGRRSPASWRTGARAPALGQVSREEPVGAELLPPAVWAEVARSLKLSPRQLAITQAVFDHLTEGAAGEKLRLSEHTVHEHLNRLFKKLRVRTRAQLVLRVIKQAVERIISGQTSLPPLCPNCANGRCRRAAAET